MPIDITDIQRLYAHINGHVSWFLLEIFEIIFDLIFFLHFGPFLRIPNMDIYYTVRFLNNIDTLIS